MKTDGPPFKRNKPKGPNPLSCKKKKNAEKPSIALNKGPNPLSCKKKKNAEKPSIALNK
ncbi:hypothetical protein MKX01_004676, partial [Papaver californicum]